MTPWHRAQGVAAQDPGLGVRKAGSDLCLAVSLGQPLSLSGPQAPHP